MERGYSLLEMLVVLAILGLIAVVAVPPISGSIEHMRLAEDVRVLAGALRDAHEEALNEQREVALTIALPNDSVLIFQSAGGGPKLFAFHGDGTASGGTFRLVRGKAAADIRVDDITGAVEIAK